MRQKIERYSGQELDGMFPSGMEHAARVYRLARTLEKRYDDDILHAACFLHNIVQGEEDFEAKSAQKAADFLHSIGFSGKKTVAVYDAIMAHRPSGNPQSAEAKMLHDAVCLDFMGATGIARMSGMTLPEWWGKETLKDMLLLWENFMCDICLNSLCLPKSRKIGEWKAKFAGMAIKQLRAELMLGDVE